MMRRWSRGQLKAERCNILKVGDLWPKYGKIDLQPELEYPERSVLVWVDLVDGRFSQTMQEVGENSWTERQKVTTSQGFSYRHIFDQAFI
ncbi:hypothetical protein TB2_044010 [Malus domestica]